MNKFKVGDSVRVRQWDDMAAEFGLDGGDVGTPQYAFTEAMEPLCGKAATIADHTGWEIALVGGECCGGKWTWIFTEDMLEPVTAKADEGKPPLGVAPKWAWKLRRSIEILDAIQRYGEAGYPIPVEWIEEYNELRETLKGKGE